MKQVYLTTNDNPFNPLTDFESWYGFDEEQGYHTCSYLARINHSSNNLSDSDQIEAIEAAIDEIIEYDLFGIYKKVVV